MRTFKLIDAFLSAGLILFFCISYYLAGPFDTIFTGYFVVGGWQVISMFVHAGKKGFTRKKSCRYYYHWITFFSLLLFPVGFFFVLLYIAPFMAMFYTGLCFAECFAKRKRPLSYLK